MRYQPPILESELLDGFNVRYLKLSGLWATINHQRTTGKKNLFIRVWVFTTIIISAPYVSFQLTSFFTIRIDLQRIIFVTIHLLLIFQLFSKMLFFWYHMDIICWVYALARKDFLAFPEGKRPQVEQIFKKISKKTDRVCLIILIIAIGIMILSIAYPVASVDYIAHNTGSMFAETGGKMKIMGGWYPVPMDQSPYYEIIYAYEAGGTFWCGIILTLYPIFFYQLLMCLYAQFNVLGYVISTLKVEVTDSVKKTIDFHHQNSNTEINKELYDILKDHHKLLSYANELIRVYNPLVSMILGMAIIQLVILLFQFLFGGTRSLMVLFRSLQYLAFQVVEVCIFCFGSSSIEAAVREYQYNDDMSVQSSDLQFAIYSSDWYKADVNFRKSAQMLMVRARKGVTLTAIKVYPVNMETIMAIFQFTYSTAALMSRMAE